MLNAPLYGPDGRDTVPSVPGRHGSAMPIGRAGGEGRTGRAKGPSHPVHCGIAGGAHR